MDKKDKKENVNETEEIKVTIKKKRKKKPERAFKDREQEYNSQKIKYAIEITLVIIFSLIIILLLCNRTFFKEEYKTSKISLNIPLLTYFIKDNGEEIELKTLRKTEYVKNFFDNELAKMTRYNCANNTFYYNDESNTAIYNIDVTKNFAVKTIKIKYAQGDVDCLCETTSKGKLATDECSR